MPDDNNVFLPFKAVFRIIRAKKDVAASLDLEEDGLEEDPGGDGNQRSRHRTSCQI